MSIPTAPRTADSNIPAPAEHPRLLLPTPMIDYNHPAISQLIENKGWRALDTATALREAYNFVRDDILFGYNSDDTLPASQVLKDGYGQCNTKGTLLMALLRSLAIPCRFHGFTIYNALQRGAIPDYIMPLAPKKILHSWIEVELEGRWLNLEGFIIDTPFLEQVQRAHPGTRIFSGYGISVACLQNPPNIFTGSDTYIQAQGIADDLGVFNDPDSFFSRYGSNTRGLKHIAYRWLIRHLINRHVDKVRRTGVDN